MTTPADRIKKQQNRSNGNRISQHHRSDTAAFQFADNRPEAAVQTELQALADNSSRARQAVQLAEIAEAAVAQKQISLEDEEELQGKFESIQKQSPEEEELMQGKFETAQKTPMDDEELMQGRFDPVQKKKANNTGLPSAIKSGIEQLSGTDISDVKVHYNSDKPARLQAHAYAQGTDIHIAPGEEKQLPHEAWHVVQQKQGRVQPTRQAPGNINVNDDAGLEREADVMGQKGLTAGRESFVKNSAHQLRQKKRAASADNRIVQRKILLDDVKADLGSLITEAHDAAERVILANWGWSATEHNFVKTKRLSAKQQLKAAIKSAKAQVIEVPALYSAANLKFLTKAAGRLPTLYFVSGNESGRIRQQHGGGPKVAGQTDKIDYFFADADGLDRFEAAARRAKKRNLAFNPTLSDYSATLTPTADALHYEVTYAGGRKIAKLHRSGGKVDPDISGYDDTRIKSIYQGAIGYTT